jgi:hypothetical protein
MGQFMSSGDPLALSLYFVKAKYNKDLMSNSSVANRLYRLARALHRIEGPELLGSSL